MTQLAETPSFEAHFPAELESVVASRKMVGAALRSWDLDGAVATDAALTVSELVSNSVLHAGTPFSVTVRRLGRGVRIEVRDDNNHLPPAVGVSKPEELLANRSMTGRGLAMVAASSDRWGADPHSDGGKVVWAEVGTGQRILATAPPPDFPPMPAPPELLPQEVAAGLTTASAVTGGGCRVHLIGVPVRILVESNRQIADLHRELQVIALDHGGPEELAQVVRRTQELATDIDHWTDYDRSVAEAALARGLERIDFDVAVSPEVESAIDRLAAWFRKVTSSLVRRHLLTLPPSPEVAAYRIWYREEIISQLSGEPPRPCPLEV
jgi:anti-sigma regulatory factor (Ser/Thr protein kinase)